MGKGISTQPLKFFLSLIWFKYVVVCLCRCVRTMRTAFCWSWTPLPGQARWACRHQGVCCLLYCSLPQQHNCVASSEHLRVFDRDCRWTGNLFVQQHAGNCHGQAIQRQHDYTLHIFPSPLNHSSPSLPLSFPPLSSPSSSPFSAQDPIYKCALYTCNWRSRENWSRPHCTLVSDRHGTKLSRQVTQVTSHLISLSGLKYFSTIMLPRFWSYLLWNILLCSSWAAECPAWCCEDASLAS